MAGSNAPGLSMVRMFIRHRVKSYGTWREHYDKAESLRQTMGVLASGVLRNIDRHEDVTVWHDFESAEKADAFAGSFLLRDAMANAGVLEAPTVWVTEEV
jgi:hypothetical protein